MSPDDIYVSTYNTEKGWKVVEQAAILQDDTGKEYSYWEEYVPLQHLLDLRDPPKGNPITFSFQYQNKVVAISNLSIPPSWIHYTDPLDEEEYEKMIISSDLSTSMKESACFTVFLVIGRTGREYHVLDAWRGRTAGNNEKCRGILAIAAQWGIVDIDDSIDAVPGESIAYKKGNRHVDLYIEDAGQQQSLKQDFTEYVYSKLSITNIRPVMVGIGNGRRIRGDKRERLSGITGLLENGTIKFNRYRFNNKSALVSELLNFGSTSYSDCVDALTLGIHSLGLRPAISTS
jgi:phage terminase large subunit-like protein